MQLHSKKYHQVFILFANFGNRVVNHFLVKIHDSVFVLTDALDRIEHAFPEVVQDIVLLLYVMINRRKAQLNSRCEVHARISAVGLNFAQESCETLFTVTSASALQLAFLHKLRLCLERFVTVCLRHIKPGLLHQVNFAQCIFFVVAALLAGKSSQIEEAAVRSRLIRDEELLLDDLQSLLDVEFLLVNLSGSAGNVSL